MLKLILQSQTNANLSQIGIHSRISILPRGEAEGLFHVFPSYMLHFHAGHSFDTDQDSF